MVIRRSAKPLCASSILAVASHWKNYNLWQRAKEEECEDCTVPVRKDSRRGLPLTSSNRFWRQGGFLVSYGLAFQFISTTNIGLDYGKTSNLNRGFRRFSNSRNRIHDPWLHRKIICTSLLWTYLHHDRFCLHCIRLQLVSDCNHPIHRLSHSHFFLVHLQRLHHHETNLHSDTYRRVTVLPIFFTSTTLQEVVSS